MYKAQHAVQRFSKAVRRTFLAAGIGAVAIGGTVAGMSAAGASTQTCNACVHIQNDYAFRGALDALHQATAINSPIGLWYEKPSTTDAGADLLTVSAGTVSSHGKVNQSGLDWSAFKGDAVVRFQYDPFGNHGADTYVGLEGPAPATATKLALRADNPNSIWQEWIAVPLDSSGHATTPNANVIFNTTGHDHYALINVGQTVNPTDPYVATDPGDSITGSLVQQDVEHANFNQNAAVPTNQIWDTQN
jgi:hypothetical protein